MAKLISAELTNNKLCVLEYTTIDGQMIDITPDSFDANVVSHSYTGMGKIIFQKPITVIKEKAFYGCGILKRLVVTECGKWLLNDSDRLTKITIPDSVTTIENYAFKNCNGLTSITIPDSVTTIGDGAFGSCSNLTSITIPNNVTIIRDYTFSNCGSLTSVTISDSVTIIGEEAFCDCKNLTSITIPDSVTKIVDYAFWGCSSLTSITIPDSVTKIGDCVFGGCSNLRKFTGKFATEDGRCLIIDGILISFASKGLTSYTIPNSVTTIGNWAFSGCSGLTSVTIPDSVTAIGTSAFRDCNNLKRVTIGKSVSGIGEDAFKDCNIDTIVCCPKIPPKIYGYLGKFNNLVVPTGCEEDYANSGWGQYLD